AVPLQLELTISWRLAAFAMALAVLSGLALGWVPAMRGTTNLTSMISQGRETGFRRSRLRNALIVVQVSVSLLLLVGSGLCLRSFAHARNVDPGFVTTDRVVVRLDLGGLGYSPAEGQRFYRALLERMSARPGVVSASATSYLPLETTYLSLRVNVPGRTPP